MSERSITEEGGLPFEQRCELATDYLRSMWDLLARQFAEQELRDTQADAERSKALLAALSPAAREVVAPMDDELSRSFATINAKLREKLWGQALAFCKDAYGEAETEFALATTERQYPRN